jgi:PQQ-dependent catabolism-associated beta-propeller protein
VTLRAPGLLPRTSARPATVQASALSAIFGVLLAIATFGCRPRIEGPLAFVSNERDGTISVIDTATDRVADTIHVGSRPRGIGVARGAQSLCIALSKPTDGRGGIDAIRCMDWSSHDVVADYETGTDPEAFAMALDGSRLYVANEDAGTASVTNTKDGSRVSHWVGLEPEGVTVSPDGRWVYVTAETSSSVSVLDTRTDNVVRSFLVGARPREVAFTPDSSTAFVSAENGGSISIVETMGHTVVGTIDLPMNGDAPPRPKGLACSPDGRTLYVATGRANTVAVIDIASRRVRGTIPVGQRPWGLAMTADGRKVYTANGLSNDVTVIDTAEQAVIATIAAGDGPWGIAVQ